MTPIIVNNYRGHRFAEANRDTLHVTCYNHGVIYHLYRVFVYEPLYNGLVFLLSILPTWANAGLAIIIFTIIVKLILFPLSKASIKNQIRMKELQPKVDEIKTKFKDKHEQSLKIMSLYKDNKLNPFSGIFLLLIQLPIIIALYSIFANGGLPIINTDILYSFIPHVVAVDMHFFGINLAGKSLILAILVAVSQFFQIKLTLPKSKPVARSNTHQGPIAMDDMMHSMQKQMLYMFPILIFIIAYPFPPISNVFPHLPAALVLYWVISNLFMIGQELFVRKKLVRKNS